MPPRKTRGSSKKAAPTPEETFQELLSGRSTDSATKYSPKAQLLVGDVVNHASFGIGVVTSITDMQKAKIFFETGERVMICNRQ